MTKAKVCFGGIPTDIEVRQLMEAYPMTEMKAGDTYSYDDVVKLIQCEVGSNRFRAVTTRWRNKVERETGKRIGAYDGELFRVMTEQEKLEAIEADEKHVVKTIFKNLRRIPNVDRKQLDEDGQKRLDHKTLNARKMLASQQQRQEKALLMPEV
jgi:hypothetical protein